LEDEFAENSSGSAAPEAQKMPILSVFSAGGAEGDRTPDLLIAKEELAGPHRQLGFPDCGSVTVRADRLWSLDRW
jgi:hypothetical protein